MMLAISPSLKEPTKCEALIRDAGVEVSAAKATSSGSPRLTAVLTAGNNIEGDLSPLAVKQILTPSECKIEALLGANSQCLSSFKETSLAS